MSPSKTTSAPKSQKCRCCTNPSFKLLELDSSSKIGGTDKTYKDVLYEITHIKVSNSQEKYLTQKVCQKCSTQLNNCYKFILQARQVYKQYLKNYNNLGEQNEVKNFENILEPLIDVPIDLITVEKSDITTKESPFASAKSLLAADEIKNESLIECPPQIEDLMGFENSTNDDIKEEYEEFIDCNNTNNTAYTDKKVESFDLILENLPKETTIDPTHEEGEQDEVKNFENILETLIDVPIDLITVEKSDITTKESSFASAKSLLAADEIKNEPLIECPPQIEDLMGFENSTNDDIKEEYEEFIDCNNTNNTAYTDKKVESFDLILENLPKETTIDPTHEEEREHFDSFNTDSEDDEDAEDPISEDDFDKDLSKAPIAISCDICHKIYKDKVALRTHKHYTHMPEEKKRPCPLCSFKYRRLSNLKVHIRVVHGADKVKEIFKPTNDNGVQFPCSICQQTFRRKDTLQRHIKRIHQNPQPREPRITAKTPKERFLCTYCGGSFRTKYGLSRHVVIHTGERPFPCEICQKTFKRPEDLHKHRIIHSDAKPHQCLQCGKAFKRSGKLKIHMRVHSELRPYKCKECEKTFKYPNVLSTHMLIHTGQNPFQCKTCGESFSLRSSFNTHCLRNGHI